MYCEHRVSYFLFPFALASISPSLIGLIKKELPFFVYATLASALVGNIAFIIHSLSSHSQLLSHVSYRLYFEDITGLHPTYMSLYLGFSICILMFQPVNIRPFYKNILYYLSFLLLFSLFAKTPIAAIFLVIIFLSVSTKGFIKQQKILFLTILLALISVIRFVPFFGQRVGEMVQYANSKDSSSNDVVSNSLYARQLIWEVNKSILKDNWLWGVGPGKVQPMMNVKYYEFYMLTNIAPVYYGPHNEYINAWLAFGLIGVVLLLFTLGLQYYMAFKNKDKLYTSLLILLTIGFITETVLSRQQGVTFYALFTSLFFFLDAKKENQLT
ncbi:MAG: O-antigen ligase family protein [Mucilaginibacter sp.]